MRSKKPKPPQLKNKYMYINSKMRSTENTENSIKLRFSANLKGYAGLKSK